MIKDFNYKNSINDIKASLFDIYENQEQVIGLIEDNKTREKQLKYFIDVKNMALMLIEGIESLYEDEDNEELEKQEKKIIENDISVNNSNEVEDKLPKKYYLDSSEENLNFAYVPVNLYEKLKNHKEDIKVQNSTDIDDSDSGNDGEFNNDIEENNQVDDSEQIEEVDYEEIIKDNKLYKDDTNKTKGIIVRNDQYMKLALSKHRQEGVIKEAKNYRIEVVKEKRKKEQEEALKKAKVTLNI